MRTAVISFACFCLLGFSVHTDERLTMRVTPPVAMAPASLTVKATIEANPRNRVLEVVAQSDAYFRSSEMSLDASSPRTSEFFFRGLPAGRYDITATLIDDQGNRVSAVRIFQATGVNQ